MDAPVRFVDVNDRMAMARWPSIDIEKAQHEVKVIDPQGAKSSGYEAAVRLVQGAVPTLYHAQALLSSTAARHIGAQAYHLVSTHRHRLSRWLFNSSKDRKDREKIAAGSFRRLNKRSKGSDDMTRRYDEHEGADIIKGAMAGTVAGLIASWVMEQAQTMMMDVSQEHQQHSEDGKSEQGGESEREASVS